MTAPPNLLDALLDDDAEHLRRAFRELAEVGSMEDFRNDEAYGVKLDRLYEEFALLNESRQLAEERATAAQSKLFRRRVSQLTSYLAPVALLSAAFVVIASLSQPIYIKSFAQKLLADLAGIQLSHSPSGARGNTPGPSDRAERTEPDRVAQSRFQERITTGSATHADRVESTGPDRIAQPESGEIVEADAAPETAGSTPQINAPSEHQRFGTAVAPTASLKEQYREKGIAAYRADDLGLALFYFDLAVQQDPESSDGYINRGIVHYRLGNAAKAFSDIDRARRIDAAKDVLGEYSPERHPLERSRFARAVMRIDCGEVITG